MRFRRHENDLEARLRDERPAPPDALVLRISHSANKGRARTGRRLGLALALTAAIMTAFLLTGGIGYAASSVKKASSACKELVSATLDTSSNTNKASDKDKGGNGNSGNGNSGNGNSGNGSGGQGNGNKPSSARKQYQDKVLICHIPPGNPNNAHTISVSPNAVPAHLAHGDYLGPCRP